MRRIPSLVVAAIVAVGLSATAWADEKPVPAKGLEFTLLTAKETYPLDGADMTAKELAEKLAEIEKAGKAPFMPPAPSKVAVTLVVKNTTDKEQTIYIDGDSTLLSLELKGPGAKKIDYPVISTKEFRLPKPQVIKPGETFTREISALEYGPRGRGSRLYWTEAGDYTLTAKWKLGGADGEGPGPVLTSSPVKFAVK